MKELKSMLIAGLLASIPSIILYLPSLNLIQIFIDILQWILGGIILGAIVLHFFQKLPGKTLFKKTFITGSIFLIVFWVITGIIFLWFLRPLTDMEIGYSGDVPPLEIGTMEGQMMNFLLFTIIFNFIFSIALSFVQLLIYSYVFSKLIEKQSKKP